MIAVLSYDAPHRKTQDLLFRLLGKGYREVVVLATPWQARQGYVPLYPHRPSAALPVPLSDFCGNLGYDFYALPVDALKTMLDSGSFRHILIGGAGILPAELVSAHRLLNAHPGYLPFVKGLDALKWALLRNHPLGATLHYVSPETDQGWLIAQREVPFFYEDSFHSLAYRLYELEIELLSEGPALVEAAPNPLLSLADTVYPPNRRMSHHLEVKMMEYFHARRRQAPSHREET